ncbi:MAG: DUF5606 domain-containing protein [Bacteroidia bacterium]
MDISEIVSISGKPGLYKVKAKSPQGLIVESMDEKRKKLQIHNNFQIALLEEITIFSTEPEDLTLREVFRKIHNKDGIKPSVSPKDDASVLRNYFLEIAPEHDTEKVYHSDLKKILKWYEILVEHGRISEVEEDEPEKGDKEAESGEAKPESKPKFKEDKPKPKSTIKGDIKGVNKTATNRSVAKPVNKASKKK